MDNSIELVEKIVEWVDENLDCTKNYLIKVGICEGCHKRISLDNRHDYMWLIEYMRVAITDFARGNDPVHENPLELWELCVNNDNFGDVLALYISEGRDWKRIYYIDE